MLEEVINATGNWNKSIAFDATNLYLSTEQFDEFNDLKEKVGNSTKGPSRKIPLDKIKKLTQTEGEGAITIHFKSQIGKSKNFYLEGFDVKEAGYFIGALAVQAQMNGSAAGSAKDYSKHYITLVGAAIYIGGTTWISTLPRTGRRSNLVKLAQDIGPVPIIILGVVIVLATLFKMYKMSKEPDNQTVYSRD